MGKLRLPDIFEMDNEYIVGDEELDDLAKDFQRQPKHIYATFEEYLLRKAPHKLLLERIVE